MRKLFPVSLIITALAFGLFTMPESARATNSRIAGSVPVSKPDENREKKDGAETVYKYQDNDDRLAGSSPKRQTPTVTVLEPEEDVKDIPPSPSYRNLSSQDLIYLESYGTQREGSLGIDLWNGSDYSDITSLLESLSIDSLPPTLYGLTENLLTTSADAGLLSDNKKLRKKNKRDSDLFTLRIEKLLDAGKFKQAADLYKKSRNDPYSERLAKVGTMALLYNGDKAIACLDGNAFQDRFKELSFWKDLRAVCAGLFSPSPKEKTSGITKKILTDTTYVFKPESINDFAALSLLERALLFSEGKISYEKMKQPEESDSMPIWMASLILQDENLPEDQKLYFTTWFIAKGVNDKDSLIQAYEAVDFPPNMKEPESAGKEIKYLREWEKLPLLYQTASAAAHGKEQNTVLAMALSIQKNHDLHALRPFSGMVSRMDITNLPDESLKKAVILLAIERESPPPETVKYIFEKIFLQDNNDTKTLFSFAALLHSMLESNPDLIEKDWISEALRQTDLAPYNKVFLKLDKTSKLHNHTVVKAYEKQIDLTLDDDYVMPSSDLVTRLGNAKKNNRLGETVLLSAEVLQNVRSKETDITLLNGVTEALSTVGLTKEARDVAKDVLIGF